MSVRDALEEIFDLGSDTPQTQFLDREEIKELTAKKIGTKINIGLLNSRIIGVDQYFGSLHTS